MKLFILCLVCFGDTFSSQITINRESQQSDSFNDNPYYALQEDTQLNQEEVNTSTNSLIGGRQILDEEEDDEISVTTTPHWTEQGCTGANEYYNACGPRCYQTCSFQQRVNGRNGKAICESIFSGNCHAGCFCQDGYVRFNEKCIKPVDCPTRLCLANEEYKIHGSPCQLTCDSYPYAAEIEEKCPKDINISGCFCKHGYVRSATGSCILPNRCPRPLVS